jgi:RNA polymerase sigma factor (sigma-70 family)
MTEADDIELLKKYAAENSDAAFAALVERHVSLVYSVALRSVGNSHAAEEITQAVFIILARKAKKFSGKTVLTGWLYQTARLTAANFLRTEIRRAQREQEAHMQSLSNDPETETWTQIAPLLDDAISKLGEKDRNAILLRYFENKSAREMADVLRVDEPAAQKRVTRAVEKLRAFFAKRGVALSAAAIAGAVSAHSVQAAPVALTFSVVAVVKGSAATASTMTLVKGTLKVMTWIKLKFAAGVAAVLVAGGVVIASIAVPASPDQIQTTKLITAIQNDDYDAFIADGNSGFKGITKEQFDAVSAQISSRLKAGYSLVYFGEMKKLNYHVTVWKVSYKDGGDDDLAELSVQDGKVGGFWIR